MKKSVSEKKISFKVMALVIIWGIIIVFNTIAWISTSFADNMRAGLMKITRGLLGRFSSIFPFSLGEILLIVAILLLAGLVVDIFFLIRFKLKKRECEKGKNYAKVVIWTFSVVGLIMTFHCFPYYHASTFKELYLKTEKESYPPEDLTRLRDHIIIKANELSQRMPREKDGQLKQMDTRKDAIKAMQNLGETYPLFSGYYPVPKMLFWSEFFSQQYIMGYYFPFTMEANYNKVMYTSNVPFCQCHELSHTKGFMYEDDANFIGYLACVNSGNEYLEYSGYLGVLDYLNGDLYEYLGESYELYRQYSQPNELVKKDNIFLTDEAWKKVEETAVFDTEAVHKASDAFLETNLKVNGVEEGTVSYQLVVQRLLEYYENHPLP